MANRSTEDHIQKGFSKYCTSRVYCQRCKKQCSIPIEMCSQGVVCVTCDPDRWINCFEKQTGITIDRAKFKALGNGKM